MASEQPQDRPPRSGAARGRWRGLAAGPVLAVTIAAVCTGCAIAPVSGGPQPIPGASGQPQAYVQPLPPPPPQPHWTPADVVLGFIHASASFALDPKAVRAYLAAGVSWRPTGNVTIVSPNISAVSNFVGPHDEDVQLAGVTLRGERIAQLSKDGQYSYEPSGTASSFSFNLVKQGGRWLISGLPAGAQLLLTQPDFEQVFEPRNLFFYAQQQQQYYLVPDPVYVPVQQANGALNTNLATSLVRGLLHGAGKWLSGVIQTTFPANTSLLGPVVITNQTALVNLGGGAAEADQGQLEAMYAQLRQTLTNQAYGAALAQNVQLAIRGQVQNLSGAGDVVPGVSQAGTGQPVYFAADGTVQQVESKNIITAPFPQLGDRSTITAVAATCLPIGGQMPCWAKARSQSVTPTVVTQPVVAVAVESRGGGCTVEVASGVAYRNYPITVSGGPCTALSWDSNSALWIVTGASIWVIQLLHQPVEVSPPPSLQAGLQDGTGRILALQMAPDGLRAAMLVQAGTLRRLYIAAVKASPSGISFGPAFPVGTDLPNMGPTAFSWDGPFYLFATEGTSLYQVPLIGPSTLLSSSVPAGVLTLSAASSQTQTPIELAVGTSNGQIFTSSSPYVAWSHMPAFGSAPSFPDWESVPTG